MDNSTGVIANKITTANRMDDSLTPGKVTEDAYDSFINDLPKPEVYDAFGGCVPDSKEAGGNLAKTQDNIRERFGLETQDAWGDDKGNDKNLY